MPKVPLDSIQGVVAPGFESVEAAFRENFDSRGELGAACCAYYQGEKVVDLWGGIRDHRTGLKWEKDTLVLVFSTTKGMASMCTALAHSRGLLDFDAPVVQYWPEFGQNGKEDVTVRQVISHQAGLSAIDQKLSFTDLADPARIAKALAAQKPAWEPGSAHGYHALSLGWYESELIRRVDPQGRTIGQFFQEEIARPLGLEFYIGLPDEISTSRVAYLKTYPRWKMLFNLNKMPAAFVKQALRPGSLTQRSLDNPKALGSLPSYNKRDMQRIELPAANGIGQIRSIAKAYSEFATGGKVLGLKAETLETLKKPAITPSQGLRDKVLRIETSYSLGFLKPSSVIQFGNSSSAFGTPGAGGSFGFADPDLQLSFAYGMNRSGYYLLDDPREKALRDAVYESVARLKEVRV